MARDDHRPAGPPVISIDPRNKFAGLFLLAAMTWPQSRRDQRQGLATWYGDLRAYLDCNLEFEIKTILDGALQDYSKTTGRSAGNITALPGFNDLREWMRRDLAGRTFATLEQSLFKPAGGWTAITEAPGYDAVSAQVERAERKGRIVGELLCIVAAMEHMHPDPKKPASLNRAVFVMQAEMHAGRGQPMPDDPSTLLKTWSEWQAIAPLHAAVYLWLRQAQASTDPNAKLRALIRDGQGVDVILTWAEWLRAWAAGFKPKRSRDHLIPEHLAARYDAGGAIPLASRPPLYALTKAQLASASKYEVGSKPTPHDWPKPPRD